MTKQFSISQQHYLFGVQSFAHTILALGGDEYSYALRDRATRQLLEDVSNGTSELGVIVLKGACESEMLAAIDDAGLEFIELAISKPHIALPASHPLSNAKSLSLEDLEPWPYLYFDQGEGAPREFAEEAQALVPRAKKIACTDRASLSELAAAVNGYTVTSGIMVGIADGSSLTTIPLETDELLHLGYVKRKGEDLDPIGTKFVTNLENSLTRYVEQ